MLNKTFDHFQNTTPKKRRPSSAQQYVRVGQTSQTPYKLGWGEKAHSLHQSQSSARIQKSNFGQQIQQTAQLRQQSTAEPLQDPANRKVWHAFGSLIAKEMTNGRGVVVPKLGHFTFTAMEVNLQGTTNPQIRDRQLREPVFVVCKDFIHPLPMKSGIMQSANEGSKTLRPYVQQGASGVIPKVKCNYFEIATISGLSKDQCVESCEAIFKYISDQVRKGVQLQVNIPMVGRLLIKNSIAAVQYNQQLTNKSRGQTTRAYLVNNLFSSADTNHNLNMHKTSLSVKKGSLSMTDDASLWLKNNLGIDVNKMPNDPEVIYQTHHHSTCQKAPLIEKLALKRAESAQNFFGTEPGTARNQDLSARALRGLEKKEVTKRPMSAARSHHSEIDSHLSSLPQASRFQLMQTANQIFQGRSQIRDAVKSPNCRITLRDPVSSSQMFAIIKKAGLIMDLLPLKQLLLALGFSYNGISTSFTLLMTGCKSFLHSETKTSLGNTYHTEALSDVSILDKVPTLSDDNVDAQKIIHQIREAFYQRKVTNGEGLYDLFLIGKSSENNSIDLNNFRELVKKVTKAFSDKEIALVYNEAVRGQELLSYERFERNFKTEENTEALRLISQIKDIFYNRKVSFNQSLYDLFLFGKLKNENHLKAEGFWQIVTKVCSGVLKETESNLVFFEITKNQDKMTFEKFEQRFKSDAPTNDKDFKTKVIRHIREWMFRNNLSSENAFDALCRTVGKHQKKNLNRALFQRAMAAMEVGLSFAKVDSLFVELANEANGEIDFGMWLAKIYEDDDNPIQMIREIVQRHQLTQDDLLHQMKLKAWDNGLTLPKLREHIRNLDSSVSDSQITSLYKNLKDASGVVQVSNLISNFTGSPFETIDFRNKIFKQLYTEIYPNNEDRVIQLLQGVDKENQGCVRGRDLLQVLAQVNSKIAADDLERFVRFLETDKLGKLNYLEFLTQVQKVANNNHNPFKTVVTRISYFMKHNNVQVSELISRLNGSDSIKGIPVAEFSKFLKLKVDKRRDEFELKQISQLIDVDKDDYVSENDIQTCIRNLDNSTFWKNGGESLKLSQFNSTVKNFPRHSQFTQEKIEEILTQIKTAMGRKNISFRQFSDDLFDKKKEKLVSFADFSRAIAAIVPLAQPVLEQLYSSVDKKGVGLITYDQFLFVFNGGELNCRRVEDNFDWEEQMINKIKQWVLTKGFTFEEAFKCFDQDFDGIISKDDLKRSLAILLHVPQDQLLDTHLDRLFRLLDFFKSGAIQISDFQRVMQDGSNPYKMTLTSNLKNSLGGGLATTSTFDWKFSAVQQVGLLLSKQFKTLVASFNAASQGKVKVTFEQLKNFFTKTEALKGFNLTGALLHELFCELDPHKKGFLTINDWNQTFKEFNWCSQNLVELKSALQVNFADCDSAFSFFLSFGPTTTTINQETFRKAVSSLLCDRLKLQALNSLWESLSTSSQINKNDFRLKFEMLQFAGTSSVKQCSSTASDPRVTIKSTSSVSSTWEVNVFEKLKGIFKASSKNMSELFSEIDQDGNGSLSQVEFRNAIRKLGLGLTSKEIDQLISRLDCNGDGKIDYKEFSSKFITTELDEIMARRAGNRMARLKELMLLHMTSCNDAFRFFDQEAAGQLTFSEFSRLVSKVHDLANEKCPVYAVVKDLFQQIDIRRDGVIDLSEWQQTFGRVTEGNNKLSIKATPLTIWENSPEFAKIGFLIAKNRKQLINQFKTVVPEGRLFNLNQGKQALDDWLHQNFGGSITDDQLKCVFRVAQVLSESQVAPRYDYIRMLDVYKLRFSALQTK